jgi:fructosamine-3-kinase
MGTSPDTHGGFTLMLLQSGNTGTDTTTGEPVIYDPSSFYGHNEAEYVFEGICDILWG